MNNVNLMIHRAVGICQHPSIWPSSFSALSRIASSGTQSFFSSQPCRSRPSCHRDLPAKRGLSFDTRTQIRSYQSSPTLFALSSSRPNGENGLTFRSSPLTSRELQDVFGDSIPPAQFAQRLLRVLHGRRVDGTLDVDLPTDMQSTLRRYPYAVDSALHWLRFNYKIDEDAAILARIEREDAAQDQDSPSDLLERGQNIGLYGPHSGNYNIRGYEDTSRAKPEVEYYGPQSGQYQAELSEKGDVFGRSELERIRAENEAKAALEEEELEKQISQITEKAVDRRSQGKSLARRPEQGIEAASDDTVRPPNEFDKWVLRAKNRGTSQLTLDSPEVTERSAISRLLPSLLLVIASGSALYLFVQSWQPPKRSERLWPHMSLSFATVCGILAANLAGFVLWKFPPAWSMMNRYFLMVPVTIKPLSLVGSIFSHSTSKHLLINAIPLLVFGPSLHEDLGRAQFLACYLMSGIIGNYVSLLYSVSRSIWITSSLGASGSVWGIMAAYCCLHSNDKFTVVFFPQEWKDTVHIKGWMFFTGLIGVDLFNLLVRRIKTINYLAHFGGAATGWIFAEIWKTRQANSVGSGRYRPKPSRPWWEFIYKGSEAQSRKS